MLAAARARPGAQTWVVSSGGLTTCAITPALDIAVLEEREGIFEEPRFEQKPSVSVMWFSPLEIGGLRRTWKQLCKGPGKKQDCWTGAELPRVVGFEEPRALALKPLSQLCRLLSVHLGEEGQKQHVWSLASDGFCTMAGVTGNDGCVPAGFGTWRVVPGARLEEGPRHWGQLTGHLQMSRQGLVWGGCLLLPHSPPFQSQHALSQTVQPNGADLLDICVPFWGRHWNFGGKGCKTFLT